MSKSLELSLEQIELLKSVLNTVSSKEEKAPVPVKDRGVKGRRYGPAEKAKILADHKVGKTQAEISEQHGVCRETLNRWVRRAEMKAEKTNPPAAVEANKTETPPLEIPKPGVPDVPLTTESESRDQHKGYHPHWREVLKTWRSRPGIGPAQICNQLYRKGIKISVSTARKIMEENGYTPPKTTIKEEEINFYEAVRPLELVHLDFKHFYINKQKVYLLLLQDDFSRFLCGHRMTDSENMKSVMEAFEECVSRYGKMQKVITDAGSAFYTWNGINKFQKLISEEYGVDQIKATTPRSNGKVENVNKQIEKEVLDVDRYASLEEAAEAIQDWIRFYNFERTHMGLPQGMVPADRFLFGWNEGLKPKEVSVSKKEIEIAAWEEVLQVVLSQIKRAA